MVFVETSVFTALVKKLLSDEDYKSLQWALVRDPRRGSLIPAAGGLRKLRWAASRKSRGRRGGPRVIYYVQSEANLYMIYLYDKSKQDDLTPGQLRQLKSYVRKGVL